NVVVSFDAKFASSRVRLSDLYDVISEPGEYYERHYLAMYNYYLDAEKRDPFDANQKANEVWMKGTDVGGLGYLVYSVPDGQMLIGRNGKLNPYATLGRMVTGIDGNTYWQVPDDWVRETYSPGFRQDYNINVRGGTNKMSVLASAGYSKEMGVTDKADYSRFTGRLKATFDAKSWLKINASLDIAVSDTNNDTDYNYNSNNIFSNATRYAPIYPIFIRGEDKNILYNEHGKVYDYGEGSYNEGVHRPFHPGSSRLQEALLQTRHTASVRTGAQIGADVKLTRDLTVTLNASYDERDRRYKTTAQPFYGSSNPGGYVTINHYKNEALNLQQLVNYVKSFGDHNVRATLLHEWYKRDLYSLYGFKTGMYSYFENQEFGGAITVNNTTSYHRPYNSEGFGGRVMYDYRNIYYFDASFRRDASSIFHPNHRWGNFFSFGAGYMLSREKFFDVPWVDELKLKVSMGQNGNDQIGGSYNRYEDAYSVENVGGQIALMFAYPGNPNITWETRTAINTGIEFQLFKGRLSGGVDYYNNITSDMLSAVSVPYSLGYSSYWANVGSMRNQGIEIELRGDIIRTKDFHWSMYVNAAMNRNKILDLADERKGETLYDINGNPLAKGYSSSAGGYFMGEGREYRTWYLRKFAGVNEKGAPLWWTADELLADKADPDDADVVIGLTNIRTTDIYSSATFFDTGKSSQPKVLGGFGGSVGWKSLQLSFAFAYRLGGYAMDEGYRTLMGTPYVGRTGYNNHKDTRNAWTPEKPNNDIPIWQFGEQYFTAASDRWLTKADFLSLQNVSLAYAVPKSFAKKIGIEGITASIGMDNLFILTHRKGFIPTRDFDGSLDYGYYPEMTRYMLNLSFKF
ncbi:MAG: SusC/RagA family TonB-linked outer membrane protein, partial [Bacteroidales bacterium]|nr:SusC/RagA family TonB-linked outer membrane protein [Bacteroidales bacterium]